MVGITLILYGILLSLIILSCNYFLIVNVFIVWGRGFHLLFFFVFYKGLKKSTIFILGHIKGIVKMIEFIKKLEARVTKEREKMIGMAILYAENSDLKNRNNYMTHKYASNTLKEVVSEYKEELTNFLAKQESMKQKEPSTLKSMGVTLGSNLKSKKPEEVVSTAPSTDVVSKEVASVSPTTSEVKEEVKKSKPISKPKKKVSSKKVSPKKVDKGE
tara:strand:- start:36 stop:683 length:648 start_codon:yes stop_codon:yes gene_type:complete